MTTEAISTERTKHPGNEAVTPHQSSHVTGEGGNEHPLEWVDLARIVFVGLSVLAVWSRVWEPFPRISVIALLATLGGGWPIFKEAIDNFLARRMTMELSMTIALAGKRNSGRPESYRWA